MTRHGEIIRNGCLTDVIDGASHSSFPEQPDAVASTVIGQLQTPDLNAALKGKRLMSSSDDAFGGRLPLAERSALSEPQQQLYDSMTKSWDGLGFAAKDGDGRFIGPFNPLLQSPVIAASFLRFQAVEQENTSLTPQVRQVVVLAVGAVWRSANKPPGGSRTS